jgi:PAS domain S-box-containing protein
LRYDGQSHQIKNNQQFLFSLWDKIPAILIVINPDTSIRYVNAAFEMQIGYSFQEALGKLSPYPWISNQSHRQNAPHLSASSKEGLQKNEILFLTRDGRQKWFEVSCTSFIDDKADKCSLITAWDVTESRKVRESMQSYIMHVVKLRGIEKECVAHKLHEEILQSLAALNLSIESIVRAKEHKPESLFPKIIELQSKIHVMINETRNLSHELKSGVLDHLGLIEALETLIDEIYNESRIKIEFKVTGKLRRLPADLKTVLYLIAQEALRNAVRHGETTRIEVYLGFNVRRVRLAVSDHGKGFEVPEKLLSFADFGKIGLINMENWALHINGKIRVKSSLNCGTTVSIEVKA